MPVRTYFLTAVFLIFAAGLLHAAVNISSISIRRSGAGPYDEAFVRAHIEAQAGAPFERFALSRDVKALMSTGRFTDVRVYAEEDGDDVRLIYEVENRRILAAPLQVEGADKFSIHHIRRLAGLEPGDYIDDTVMGQRALKVSNEYRQKHYPDIKVDWRITDDPQREGFAFAELAVSEGERARVTGAEFSNNTVFSDYELGRLMKRPAWWNPFWWLKKRKLNEEEAFEGRLAVQEHYRNAGYLDVQVGRVEYARDDDGNIVMQLDVREGVQFRINRILLSGVNKFPESSIRSALLLKTGDIAASQAIDKDVNAVRDFYGSRGYIDTYVRHVLQPVDGRGLSDLLIVVEEGTLCYVRNISIEGNTRTRDKVIRRELLVEPGDIFNEVRIRASEKRLSNLGYFSSVRSFPAVTQLDDQRNLILEVEEQRTGQFMMGAGFSSIDKATVFTELSQGNFDLLNWPYFTGGGQKLKLSAQLGTVRRDFLLSFTEPWFLNRKIRFGFDIYDRLVKYDDYDSRRTGASVGLGRAVSEHGRVDVGYTIEKLSISDIADTNEYFTETGASYYFAEEEDNVSSSMRFTYTHDGRDNPFIPSTGGRLRIYGGVTGGPFGFDTDFYESGISYSRHFPVWRDHVLNLKASYDAVEEFGDSDEVRLDDRLFLGGGRTLRGFRYRDVGPKVTRSIDLGDGVTSTEHRPIGGNSRFMATAEYSIPVVKPVRFAVFYDTGNVWSDAYDADFSDLASSAGAGLRFDVPGFPIRIDFAEVIEKDDELSRTESWVLWIGYDI